MPAVAVAAIGAVAALAAAGVSAYSSYQQGKAQKAMNDYNAELANQEADTRERDSRIMAQSQREESERMLAQQRGLYAVSGAMDASGSPLMVLSRQASENERIAQESMRVGSIQGAQLRSQSALDKMAGQSAWNAARMNAGATLLQGVSSAASSFAGSAAGGGALSSAFKTLNTPTVKPAKTAVPTVPITQQYSKVPGM